MVSLAGSAYRVKGVKIAHSAITQEWLGRLSPNLCVVRAHVAMHIPQVMDSVHLDVHTCARADVPQCSVVQERLDGLR